MQTATPIISKVVQAYRSTEEQARLLLQALENCRSTPLTTRCICYLAHKVARSWESNPSPETVKAVYCLMIHLFKSTALCPDDGQLENGLQYFCQSTSSSIPTICPSLTLLMAVHYIGKLKHTCGDIKSTTGCATRITIVAYITASKFLQSNLRMIINAKGSVSPPSVSTDRSAQDAITEAWDDPEKRRRLKKMELEFLHLLNYNLFIQHPCELVWWAQAFQTETEPPPLCSTSSDYTSADEGDDELDTDTE